MFAAALAILSAPAESPDTSGLVGIVVSETDFRLVTSPSNRRARPPELRFCQATGSSR